MPLRLSSLFQRQPARALPAAITALWAIAGLVFAAPALAQSAAAAFPERPIKLIVPFAPGGSTDIVARLVAERMQQSLGQPVTVDNRAGAGGSIGAEAVARAPADGYTLGMGTVSTLAVNPVLLKSSRVDPQKDLAPVIALASIPSVFSVHPDLRVASLRDFIALARSKPDQLSAGSPGTGSIGHLIIEALDEDLQVQVRHIPYKGMGPVINGALAGETQLLSDQAPSSLPFIKSGKLVPLAVAADRRLASLPQVPTLQELGYRELNELAITWFGLVVPAGTPAPVVARLNAAAQEALRDPALQPRLAELGVQAMGGTPEQFGRLIASSLARVRKVVQLRRIEME